MSIVDMNGKPLSSGTVKKEVIEVTRENRGGTILNFLAAIVESSGQYEFKDQQDRDDFLKEVAGVLFTHIAMTQTGSFINIAKEHKEGKIIFPDGKTWTLDKFLIDEVMKSDNPDWKPFKLLQGKHLFESLHTWCDLVNAGGIEIEAWYE